MSKKIKNNVIVSFFIILALFLFVNAFFAIEKNVNNGKSARITADIPANTLRVHYQRTKGDYDNFTLWLWLDTTWTATNPSWPNGLDFAGKDDFGVYFDVPLNPTAASIGFVPVNKTIGDDSKDAGDHIFQFLSYKEIWVFQEDPTCYVSKEKGQPKGIVNGQISGNTTLELTFVNIDSVKVSDFTVTDKDKNPINPTSVSAINNGKCTLTISSTDYKTKAPYNLTYEGKVITLKTGPALLDVFAYEGNDLGASYSSSSTTFKLWAPMATWVKLTLYDKDNQASLVKNNAGFGTDVSGDILMQKGSGSESGVWSVKINGDMKGYFYQFKVKNEDIPEKLCLDPYAKSMAAFYLDTNGKISTGAPDDDKIGKGAIIDLADTNVAGLDYAWKTSSDFNNYYKQREDAIIYEVHVRDFTSFWGVNTAGTTSTEVNKPSDTLGTYKAFITNLPYLKKMGYTHIQLLPIMNFLYGDETNKALEPEIKGKDCNYNWGFDPHHYFTPEGMYATDAVNPNTRVKELKELIHAIHQNGMGVVLDVVYTHMAKYETLGDIVPMYYCFVKDGQIVGGFGNNLATTHKMPQKLMVDSVKYWLSEYKIDGFRFDMMGDGTDESIMEVYREASKINDKVLLIGEGWRTFAGEGNASDRGADQDAMNKINDGSQSIYSGISWTNYSGVGVFSDEFRNLMKSGFGSETTPRFLTGGEIDTENLFKGIKGQPTNFNTASHSVNKGSVDDPGQVVQYIAAHDNETLHDVIMMHLKKDPRAGENEELIHKRIRMGNLVLLTTQGIAFMHAGQELGRTKSFGSNTGSGPKVRYVEFDNGEELAISRDSYDSSDFINQINWSFIEEGKPGKKTMEYTKGLIKLRKSTDAFRLGTKSKVSSNVTIIKPILD